MQPLTPIEVAQRIAEERRQLRRNSSQKKSNTQRRYDLEFERELRSAGLDVRKGVEL